MTSCRFPSSWVASAIFHLAGRMYMRCSRAHLRGLLVGGCGAGIADAVAVLDKLVAAGVTPGAVTPVAAPHRRVVVDQYVLLVPRPRGFFLPPQQPPYMG